MDTSLKRILFSGPEGVRLQEVLLYCNVLAILSLKKIIFFPFLAIRLNDSSIRITKAARKCCFQESLEERDVI